MDKTKAGYTEGIVSIVVNTLLFALKFSAGIITGSIALTADAWHTLSDSVSSVVVVVAVKLSSKKADKEHPFGHGKWEQIAALFIAFILGIIAYDFLKNSIIRLKDHQSVHFGLFAIVVTIISIVIKEALAQYAFYIARKTDNVTVRADGWHHRSDALSSVVVLVGILFASRFWWIDAVLGIIVAIMLFYATYEIVRESVNKLLGEKPSPELIKQVIAEIESTTQDNLFPHHFHIHNYVSHQELTFHIKLDNKLSINDGHQLATTIENKILNKYGIVATIHVEPIDYIHNSD